MAEGHRLKDQKDDCECLDALPYMVILRGHVWVVGNLGRFRFCRSARALPRYSAFKFRQMLRYQHFRKLQS